MFGWVRGEEEMGGKKDGWEHTTVGSFVKNEVALELERLRTLVTMLATNHVPPLFCHVTRVR